MHCGGLRRIRGGAEVDMKKRGIHATAAGLICILLFSWAGCGRGTPPAEAAAVLSAMCETADTALTCRTYTRAAAPSDGAYLSDTLFSALYGEAARGLLQESDGVAAAINDAAVCLSMAASPVELAVLRCSDVRGTATAAGLCRARLDAVRRAWAGTAWEAMTAEGTVTVVGSYVLLVIAPHPDKALRAARRLCD